MNAAGTMMRVYQALKVRIMAGEFAPGERIDPARLSIELAASATPIRDALHRLAGERLVESWQHEGFRQPAISEAALRDLYGWSEDVLHVVLRAVQRHGSIANDAPPLSETFLLSIAALTSWLGQTSPNHEHAAAIIAVNERCSSIRMLEQRIFASWRDDLTAFADLLERARWGEAQRWNVRFHGTRQRHVSDIVALVRRREP